MTPVEKDLSGVNMRQHSPEFVVYEIRKFSYVLPRKDREHKWWPEMSGKAENGSF